MMEKDESEKMWEKERWWGRETDCILREREKNTYNQLTNLLQQKQVFSSSRSSSSLLSDNQKLIQEEREKNDNMIPGRWWREWETHRESRWSLDDVVDNGDKREGWIISI